jgi:hypothetical protein
MIFIYSHPSIHHREIRSFSKQLQSYLPSYKKRLDDAVAYFRAVRNNTADVLSLKAIAEVRKIDYAHLHKHFLL